MRSESGKAIWTKPNAIDPLPPSVGIASAEMALQAMYGKIIEITEWCSEIFDGPAYHADVLKAAESALGVQKRDSN